MSIQPYLTSDGKISGSMIQGGGVGANENIAQCLATGNDGAGLNMQKVNGIQVSQINTVNGNNTLAIGSATSALEITSLGSNPQANTQIEGPLLSFNTTDLKFPNSSIFDISAGAPAGKYLIIKDDNNIQYKIKLLAMS